MKKQYLFAGISIFCWSTVPVVTKTLLGTINNVQLLWLSSLFSFSLLLIINLLTGKLKSLRNFRFKDILIILLIGFPGTFLYYIFYYAGNALIPASQAFMINYLWPIMSTIFACIILKERLTVRKILAIVISFIGVCIFMLGNSDAFHAKFLTGALLCFLAAVSYGAYTVLIKKFHYDIQLSLMFNFFVTFLLTGLINLYNGDIFVPEGILTAGIIWNGILGIVVPDILWHYALRFGKTERISNLAYITPALSLVWTFIILKDPFNIYNLIGIVIIFLGIILQFKKSTKTPVTK